MAGLLAGVKVLESAVLIVGDYLGMLLADEGAEEIKVESPGTGDYIREYMGEEILGELGLSASEIERLRDRRLAAARGRPPAGQPGPPRGDAGDGRHRDQHARPL
jgi:crotonobetainyl-CoA:carnitine CoA-transferase CaiB-like acyl-CoA transferase